MQSDDGQGFEVGQLLLSVGALLCSLRHDVAHFNEFACAVRQRGRETLHLVGGVAQLAFQDRPFRLDLGRAAGKVLMIFLHEDCDIAWIQQPFLQRRQHPLFVQMISDGAIVGADRAVATCAACPNAIADDVPWPATAAAPADA
ncbi:hypothetical protein [Sphingobium sp. S8]|uniref:hypothetical protein n=1 Tax=Sphingobium sp. S8 TaxID=2758385 RepID=UPI001F41AD6C|nr:hypothetical protein [Sphingobium sp. S8]